MTLAHRLLLLAIDMEDAAADLRTEADELGKLHADELAATAQTVREWARECES